MNVEWRQAAADPRPSQTTYAVSPPVQAVRNYTHHRHLLLLSPKADTHFTIPQRVEGWVDLTLFSSSHRSLTLNISQTATDMAIVTKEGE